MHHEIDRRFLIENMPSLRGAEPVIWVQYFIQCGDLIEEKVQEKEGVFEYETEVMMSSHNRTKEKRVLSKDEFSNLKALASNTVTKERYLFSKKSPRISINKYKGEHRGLTLAEVEFDNEDDLDDFEPLPWMGTEITDTQLGRDSKLACLDREIFLKLLSDEKEKLTPDQGSYM